MEKGALIRIPCFKSICSGTHNLLEEDAHNDSLVSTIEELLGRENSGYGI
jgi:hypothetical protein